MKAVAERGLSHGLETTLGVYVASGIAVKVGKCSTVQA